MLIHEHTLYRPSIPEWYDKFEDGLREFAGYWIAGLSAVSSLAIWIVWLGIGDRWNGNDYVWDAPWGIWVNLVVGFWPVILMMLFLIGRKAVVVTWTHNGQLIWLVKQYRNLSKEHQRELAPIMKRVVRDSQLKDDSNLANERYRAFEKAVTRATEFEAKQPVQDLYLQKAQQFTDVLAEMERRQKELA